MTYNVHGLPSAITGDNTAERMTQIAPLLSAFDIVGLQEDFVEDHHAALVAESTHVTQHRFAEALTDRAFGSGLAVLAHFEAIEHQHLFFEDCHGLLDSASDCLASKGLQRVRLRLEEDVTLDVYCSHLEAGGSAEDHLARQGQVAQVTEAMLSQSEGRAILFLGDTNLHGSDSDDATLMDTWTTAVGLFDACEATSCPEPGRIDRLLFRSGDQLHLEATAWTREEAFYDPEGEPLSDHDALSAVFSWTVK